MQQPVIQLLVVHCKWQIYIKIWSKVFEYKTYYVLLGSYKRPIRPTHNMRKSCCEKGWTILLFEHEQTVYTLPKKWTNKLTILNYAYRKPVPLHVKTILEWCRYALNCNAAIRNNIVLFVISSGEYDYIQLWILPIQGVPNKIHRFLIIFVLVESSRCNFPFLFLDWAITTTLHSFTQNFTGFQE